MVSNLQASNLSLRQVQEQFNLQAQPAPQFFTEWQGPDPTLEDWEQQWLERAASDFRTMAAAPMHEEIVKLVMLSPLLSIAGFFRSPFSLTAEKQIELAIPDRDILIRGRIDILALQQSFWVTVIESKQASFHITQALPQALVYMLAAPPTEGPCFGMATNGWDYLFIKLVRQDPPCYGLSPLFSLLQGNSPLIEVVGGLRRLGKQVGQQVDETQAA
jgi:hypothetical protein